MKDHPLQTADIAWLAGLARALIRDPHAADDLVQDTVVAALDHPPSADVPRRAWLASVARRLAARRFRGESRRARREATAARFELLPDTAELVERAELAELIAASARRLPEPFRRTILLRFLEGLDVATIAEREERSMDTVRWRTRRGLDLMRVDLSKRHARDWSAWSVLLLPLARQGNAGPAAVGTVGAFAGMVAGWTTMKLMMAGVLVLCGVSAWFVLGDEREGPSVSDGREIELVDAAPPGSDRSRETALSVEVADATSVVAEEEPVAQAAPATDLFGVVLDVDGKPHRRCDGLSRAFCERDQ